MMIDKRLEFADAQALTVTANLTNDIDLSSDRDVGVGVPLYWVITLDVAADFTSANETYVFTLTTDDNASFSSATTIATITVPGGSVAGTKFATLVPLANERYLRAIATLGGTTPTVTVSSQLSPIQPPMWAAYPDAI